MERKRSYPEWVCQKCAEDAGGGMHPNHMATWHQAKCDVCKKENPVTQPRDFGYPEFNKAKKKSGKTAQAGRVNDEK